MKNSLLGLCIGLAAVLGVQVVVSTGASRGAAPEDSLVSIYIVQAGSATEAQEAILSIGGEVVNRLDVINAMAAWLSPDQAVALREHGGTRVFRDASVAVSGQAPDTFYPAWVGATRLHAMGLDGSGVGIAIVDTGLWPRVFDELGVQAGIDTVGVSAPRPGENFSRKRVKDGSGHGTHITSVVAGRETSDVGAYEGVAPGAEVYVVRAFDDSGIGTYVDVIEGIQWVIDQRDELGIRVLNLSFSADPQSYYWDDPLNQAVMAAWEAGIVVVTSAGNTGPGAMTVGVPGNVPYVVTVGSVDDNYTPKDQTDDFLSTFSSAGPTYERFVKPEVAAPGGHVLAHMNPNGEIARAHREHLHETGTYFAMSGTSQAAAVVSGVAALVLQADPSLSPDDVKCRLISAAKPVVDGQGQPLYSLFQQGAGLVFAPDAVLGQQVGCANVGLDVSADLSGETHYIGPAAQLQDGTFVVLDRSRQTHSSDPAAVWDGQYSLAQGYTWSGGDGGTTTPDGYTWSGGDGGTTTPDGYTWSGGDGGTTADGYTWSGGDGGTTTPDGYTWSGGDGGTTTPDGYTWSGGDGGTTTPDGYTWSGGDGGTTTPDGYTWSGGDGGTTTPDGYTWSGGDGGTSTPDAALSPAAVTEALLARELGVVRWVEPDTHRQTD